MDRMILRGRPRTRHSCPEGKPMATLAEKISRGRMTCVAGFCLALAGCQNGSDPGLQPGQLIGGATRQITEVQPATGFLPQPGLLRPGKAGQPALLYANPRASLSVYDKVILDPVTVWAAPNSSLNAVPPEQRQALADTFNADLHKALGKTCHIVNDRSPGTLRLRFAIVDTKTPQPVVNTVATYVPYGSTAYTFASLAFNKGVGFFAGTATVEGYASDATNGTILWEAVDKRGGTTALVEDTFDTWLDVHHAFEAWSEQLATRLREAGVCRKQDRA